VISNLDKTFPALYSIFQCCPIEPRRVHLSIRREQGHVAM